MHEERRMIMIECECTDEGCKNYKNRLEAELNATDEKRVTEQAGRTEAENELCFLRGIINAKDEAIKSLRYDIRIIGRCKVHCGNCNKRIEENEKALTMVNSAERAI
jgi:hypothetical protein